MEASIYDEGGRTGVNSLLHGMRPARGSTRVEERVVGQAVQQRRLLHDLEDRVLDRRGVRAGEREEVERDDRDPVRELL